MQKGELPVLHYAIVFLVVGLIAGLPDFSGIAGISISIAQCLFFLFMLFLILSLLGGFPGRRKTPL